MIGLFTILGIGLFLGMRHATDPDHVIAVSTIVTREHSIKRSAVIGAVWGAGHTLTILLVGGAIILFRIALPPRVGLTMELAVGIMLIALGIKNLGPILNWLPTSNRGPNADEPAPHYHAHGDYIHAHGHADTHRHPHDPERTPVATLDSWFKRSAWYAMLRPLLIGIVHGLAGSAAIALLVLSTIPNMSWAFAYLAIFGLGTVFGMMLITLTIGSGVAFGRRRFVQAGQHLGVAAGVVSLAFGFFIAYDTGIVHGLFTSHANWIPH